MQSYMASSSQQSLRSRLFGTWAASGDEVTVLKIDKDSLYYVNEYPIVAIQCRPYEDILCLPCTIWARFAPYIVKID